MTPTHVPACTQAPCLLAHVPIESNSGDSRLQPNPFWWNPSQYRQRPHPHGLRCKTLPLLYYTVICCVPLLRTKGERLHAGRLVEASKSLVIAPVLSEIVARYAFGDGATRMIPVRVPVYRMIPYGSYRYDKGKSSQKIYSPAIE